VLKELTRIRYEQVSILFLGIRESCDQVRSSVRKHLSSP
jgi:hypothetical protein